MPPTSLKDVLQPASLGYTRVLTTITVDVNIDDIGNVRIDCVREDKDLGNKRALLPKKTYWTEEYRWNRLTVGSPVERRNWSLKSIAEGVDAPAEEYLRYIEGRASPEPEESEAGPEVEAPESTDGEKTDSDVSYPIPEINSLDTAVEADETFSSEEEEDRPPAPPPRVDSVTTKQDEQPDETVAETDNASDGTHPEDAEELEVEEVVLRIVEPLDEISLRKSEEVCALPPESPDIIQDTSVEDTIIPEADSDQQVEEEDADVDKDASDEDQEEVDGVPLKSPTKRVRFNPEAIYVTTTVEEAVDEEGVSLSPIPEEDTTPGKQIKEPDTTREEGKDADSDADDETQDTQISVEVDVHVSADKEAEDDEERPDAPLAEEEILTDDEATGSTADDKEDLQTEDAEEGEHKEEESGPSTEEAHESEDEADEKEQGEEKGEPQAPDEKASIEEEEPPQEDEAARDEEEVLDESDVSSVPRESLGEEELQALISDDWDLLTYDEPDDDDYPPLNNGYCPPKSPVGGQVAEAVVVEFDESYAEVLKKAPPPDAEEEASAEEDASPEDESTPDTETPQEHEAPSEEEATSEDKVPLEDEPADTDTKRDDSPSIGPDTPKEEESESEEEKTTAQADEPEEEEDIKPSEATPSPKEEKSTPDDEKDQESEGEEKSQPPSDEQPEEAVEDPQESYSDEWDLSDYEAGEEDFPPLRSYRPPKSPIGGKPTEPVAAEFAESFAAVVTKPPPVVEEAVEEAEPVESVPSTQDSGQTEDDLPDKEEEQEESPSEEHAVRDISPEEEEGEESSKDNKDDSDTKPQDAVTEQKDEDLPVSDGAASDDEAVMVPSEVTEGDDKADDEEDVDGGSLEAVRGDTPTEEDLSEKADFESSEKTEGEDSAGADTSSVGSTEHDLKKDNKSDEAVCDPLAEISADDVPTEEAEDVSESSAADNTEVEKETHADESGEETITSDHEATDEDTEEPVKEEDNKRSLLQRQKAMSKGESVESQESASSADTSEKAAASKTPATPPSTDEPEHQDDVKANEDIPEEDEQTGDDDDEALNKVQDGGMPKTSGTKSQDSSDSEDDSSSKIQPQALATGESTPRDDTKEQSEFAVTSADREYQPNTGASNEGNKECSDGHCYSEPLAVSLPHSEMPCPEQDTGRLRVLPWARWEKIDDTSPRTVRRRPPSLELEAPVDEATSEETSPIQQSAEPMDIKEANESTPRRCSTSSTDSSEGEEEEEEAISSGDEEGEFDVPERTESPEDRMTRTDAWATSGGTVYIGAATRMVRKQLPDIPEHSREDDSDASDDDNQQDEVERPRQSAKLADSRSSEYDRHHEERESSDESDDDLDDEELHYLDNDDEEQVMLVEESVPEGNPLYLRQIHGETYTQEQTIRKDDTSSDDSEDEDKRQADVVREHDRLLELQEDLFEKDSLDDVDYHVTSSEVLREGEGQSNMSVIEPTDYRRDDGQNDDLMAFEQVDPSNANEILLASEGPGEDMDSDHEEFQVTVSEEHLADTSTQHLIVITKDTDKEEEDRFEEKTSMDSFESSGPSTEGSSDMSGDEASNKKERRRRRKYGAQRSFTEAIHHDPDSPTYISRMQFQFQQSQTTELEQGLEGFPAEQECTPIQENIPFNSVTGRSQQRKQMCVDEDQTNEDGTETTVQEPGAESVSYKDQEDDTFDLTTVERAMDANTDSDDVRAVSSDVPRDDDRRRSAEYTDSSDSESDTDSSESETSADSILASPGNGGPGPSGGQYRAPMSTVPVTSYYVTSGVPFTMDPTTSEHVEIPPMPTSPRHSWGMQANYSFEEHQPVTTGLLTPIINGHIPVVKHHVQYDDLKRPIIPILLDIGDKLSPEYSGETKTAETSNEREMLSPSPYDNLLESDLAEGEAQEGLSVESLQAMSCRCIAPPPDRKPFESPSEELELPPNPDFEPMDCLCTNPHKEARVVWSPKLSPRHSPQNVERCYEAISNTLATSRHNYVESRRREQDAEDETTVLNQSQSLHGDDSVGDLPEDRTVTMLQFDMEDDRSSETSSPLSVHSTRLGSPPILEEELDDSPAFSPTRQTLDTFIPVSPPVSEIRHPGITQDAIRAPSARKFTETEDSMTSVQTPTSHRDNELKTPTGSLVFPYDKIHGPYPPPDQPSFVTPDRRTQVKRKRPSDDVQGTSPRPSYTSPVRPREDSPAEKCLSPTDHQPKKASPSKIPDDFPKLCTGKVRSMVNKWEEIVKHEPPKSPLSSPSTPEIPRYGERDVISPPFSHHGSSPYYMSRRRTVSEEERSPEGAAATQQKVPKHNVDVSARRPLHGSQIPTDEEEECMIAATEYGVPLQPASHEDDAEKVLVYGYEVEWDIPRLQVCLSPLEGFDDEDSEFSDDVTISSLTETDGEGGVSASLSSLEEYILDPARILGKASSFTELPMSPVEEEEESPAEDSAQGSSNTKEALSSHSVWERLGVLETPCPYFCQMWLPMLKYHLLDFQ